MRWIKTYENFKYKLGDIFTDEKERSLCSKLNKLGSWMVWDLGLKNVIDDILKNHKVIKDYNDDYQVPLKILHDTGNFNDILFIDGKYFHKRFKGIGLVKDENDQWHFVNKLNTNYSDLAELLTKVLVDLKLDYIGDLSIQYMKSILLEKKQDIINYIKNYFDIDSIKEFTRNTKVNSNTGEKAEDYAKSVLEKFGMETLYNGGNGDFIDMVFGIDLIMKYKERIIICQVKARDYQAKNATKNKYYNRVNYFISPIDGIGNGIVIYNKKGESFMIDDNGKIIK